MKQTQTSVRGLKTSPPAAVIRGTLRASKKPLDSRTLVVERQREIDRIAAATAKKNAPTVVTTPTRRAQLLACLTALPGNTRGTQADRLLRALMTGPLTTLEARQYLEIMSPASRVFALKTEDGVRIETLLVQQKSPRGTLHEIAQYTLIHESATPL